MGIIWIFLGMNSFIVWSVKLRKKQGKVASEHISKTETMEQNFSRPVDWQGQQEQNKKLPHTVTVTTFWYIRLFY